MSSFSAAEHNMDNSVPPEDIMTFADKSLAELEEELGCDIIRDMERAIDDTYDTILRILTKLPKGKVEAKLSLILMVLSDNDHCDIERVLKMMALFRKSESQSWASGSFSQTRAQA
jgi:hypothetical protein